MSDNSGLTRMEVELVARKTVDAFQEKFRTDIIHAIKPLMFEVAEKVSTRNNRELNLIFQRIFNINFDDTENIRSFQEDLFWVRSSRMVRKEEMANFRNHLISALIWLPLSILVAMFLAWAGLRS